MDSQRIIEKAKKLGINTSSGNSLEQLEEIALHLGINDFDPTGDLSVLEDALDAELGESEELLESDGVETLDDESVSYNEEIPEQQRRPRFGEEEYNAAKDENGKYDKDYYKKKSEELDEKVKQAEEKKKSNQKEVTQKGPDGQQNKFLKDKNILDKAKDNADLLRAKNDRFQNRINGAKSKMNQMIHPGEALKAKAKDVAKNAGKKVGQAAAKVGKTAAKAAGKAIATGVKALISFLASNPIALVIILGVIVVIFIIIFFVGGISGTEEAYSLGYYDSTCNFNESSIVLTSCDGGSTINLTLKDYVMGTTYSYIKDDDYSDEAIKAIMIISKTNAFSLGNYGSSQKTLNINDCDMNNTLVSNIDSDTLSKLEELYSSIEEEIFISNSYTGTIDNLSSNDYLQFDSTILEEIKSYSSSKTYSNILRTIYYDNKAIYKLSDNCTYYEITENDAFWWPIGSANATDGNIYGGSPVTTNVSSPFGYRTHPVYGDWRMHNGIDISDPKDNCGEVIIAAKAGTVTRAFYNGGYGNFVEIDHGDGIMTRYAHILDGSYAVEAGDKVEQGQKLGLVGTTGTSTGCHLHFEVLVNGARVDPLEYVSAENPRAVTQYNILQVNDSVSGYTETKSEICKALLKSGFSENAVAGMLVNIQAEGSFSTNNLEGCYETGNCCPQIRENYGFCNKGWNGDIYANDNSYTDAINTGLLSKEEFVNDRAGYGLIQWTSSGRKTGLYDYAKSQNKSIAALSVQLGYLLEELRQPAYSITYKYITGNYSTYEVAYNFCVNFERPAGTKEYPSTELKCDARANAQSSSMLTFVQNGCSN